MSAVGAADSSDLLISYTLFPSVWPREKTERIDVPWSEVVAKIRDAPTYIDKAHCPLVSLCAYGALLSASKDNPILRHAANVERCYGVELDYDDEEMPIERGAQILQAAGLLSVLYTSPSYTAEKPRWRALFPLSEPALPEKRGEYVGRANRVLGGVASRESFTLSQSFYIGRVRGVEYKVLETTGRCLDLAADLEPLYYAGYEANGERVRDETTDADLRAAFERGQDRYTAMLKLSSRWAARGLGVDDIENCLHALLGSGTVNADGIDLRTRCRPLAESAVRKFGETRPAMRHTRTDAPGEELPPVETHETHPDGSVASAAPAAVEPQRHPMLWDTLHGQTPPERKWLIPHWLSTGATLLAGQGGVGKTLIVQMIATALALGHPYLDAAPAQAKVLLWACEDEHDELWRRQVAICRYFGVNMRDLKDKLIIEPRAGMDNTLFVPVFGAPIWTPLRAEMTAQVKDYDASVLIVDNIGQTFGCSENDRHQVTAFVNGFISMADSTILLGHPAKAAGSEFSGSTAWENAVRMRWYLGSKLPNDGEQKLDEMAAPTDSDVRYLARRKANYTVKDYRKLIYQDGVFHVEGSRGHLDRYGGFAQRNEGAEDAVLSAIRQLAEVKITGRVSPTSPDYLPKKMAQMKLMRDHSARELQDALNRLVLAQKVREVEVGKLANRMPRMGLIIC